MAEQSLAISEEGVMGDVIGQASSGDAEERKFGVALNEKL